MLVWKENGEWERYDFENSGLPHNEVLDMVLVEGGLWVLTNKQRRSISTTMPSYNSSTGAVETSPSKGIEDKIYNFDPNSAITFFKL